MCSCRYNTRAAMAHAHPIRGFCRLPFNAEFNVSHDVKLNARHIDDPRQRRLDPRRLFHFHQRMNLKATLLGNYSPLPHFNPVIPPKSVDKSDSSAV